ncbi:MAG: phage major capsid protein [Ruminococcus sp.]|nr:phage major capsid protein [Ruminococcus sp.]
MAINFEAYAEKKTTLLGNISAAVKENDADGISKALDEWASYTAEIVTLEAKGIISSNDNNILAARGKRPLTSAENAYYTKLIAAMKSSNPKAEIAKIEEAFPETIIDTVLDDIEQSHPLLGAIGIINTTVLTKWIINTKGVQTAVWGKLGSAITEELEGSIDVLTLGMYKLSAFMYIEKDMLDLGPVWVDRYIRAMLTDASATGLEAGFVSGTGKDMPIGMDRDLDGGTNGEGEYSKKDPITVTTFSPQAYGDLIARMSLIEYGEGEVPRYRDVDGLILVVNPLDYFRLVLPATTIQTPDGRYVNDVLPYPTRIIRSAAMTQGQAILGIGKRYFAGVGTGKNGKIEYSDEFKFLDDMRTYKIKMHATARPMDNNSFLLLDISGLMQGYYTINTTGDPLQNVTVAPEEQSKEVYGALVSHLQGSDVRVEGNKIKGTLHYVDDGSQAAAWGAGNFLVVKFSNIDPGATSVRVGLQPSAGSGLMELLGDPDMNAQLKITNKKQQKLKVISSNGFRTNVQTFDLSGLTLETE